MEQGNAASKQRLGFGGRGWILIIVLFLANLQYTWTGNYPVNILAEDFLGGAQRVAILMTVGTFIGLVFMLLLSNNIGKIKSVRNLTIWIGIFSIIVAWIETAIPLAAPRVWYVVYTASVALSWIYALFFLTLILAQWFPRRKGTVIGVATIAFPFGNAMVGVFANSVYKPFSMGIMVPAIFKSFLPFVISATVGLVLFILFIKDYPEQCGAYRDNDRSFTMEQAQAMMEQEIEDKKTTVWTPKRIFGTRDFWFIAIPCGLMLMAAVGAMSQTATIIATFPNLNYTVIMMVIAVFGAIGSWLLGFVDTRVGTKFAIRFACILIVISGIFGWIAARTGVGVLLVISLALTGVFMGASSNFTVSASIQYWRREDFQGVYACVNPIANILNALAPTVIAALLFSGPMGINVPAVFIFITIAGIISVILAYAFSNKNVKKKDDRLRTEAGKALDDELEKRK